MPYILQERRTALETGAPISSSGELNYLITTFLIRYWQNSPQNYAAINDVSGACTEALAEFRRRIVVDYENEKVKQNGDVYHV